MHRESTALLPSTDSSLFNLKSTFPLESRDKRERVRSANALYRTRPGNTGILHSQVARTFRRSQTGCDDTNADGKRRETRDYSPRTSLQVGKIWSQVRDVCRNVVKLAAMSVGRVARDDAASESERSRRNPVEVADATLDVPPCSPSTCASGICGETCRKNLIRSEAAGKSTVRRQEERAIENVGKCREDAEPPTRREDDARRRARKNAGNGGDEKSCVFCDGTINSNQSSPRARARVYLLH